MINIDYNILIKNILPISLRKAKLEAFIKCLIAPLKFLYLNYKDYRISVNKRVEYTGQVIYLEKLLRDSYNEQGISIIDNSNIEYSYLANKLESNKRAVIYNKLENETKYYLKNMDELTTQIHFLVEIPITLYNNLGMTGRNKMRALIDMYRLAGKKYLIIAAI
jgi:hypothetical protein